MAKIFSYQHVHNRTSYLERRTASTCRFLTSTATATLVSAFTMLKIDYCNTLLFGSYHDATSNLHQIQNYAAQVIIRIPKSADITAHLKSICWHPVKVRSTYEIACLYYRCHSSTAPSYVADMMQKIPSHSGNNKQVFDIHCCRPLKYILLQPQFVVVRKEEIKKEATIKIHNGIVGDSSTNEPSNDECPNNAKGT